MTVPLHHPVVVDPAKHSEGPAAAHIDPVAVFELRAWARAYLWSVGELDLHEAVDVLQRDAAFTGLLFRLGQDRIQQILRDAFHQYCERAPENPPASTLQAAENLVRENDPKRLRAWLATHSAQERKEILRLLERRRKARTK